MSGGRAGCSPVSQRWLPVLASINSYLDSVQGSGSVQGAWDHVIGLENLGFAINKSKCVLNSVQQELSLPPTKIK